MKSVIKTPIFYLIVFVVLTCSCTTKTEYGKEKSIIKHKDFDEPHRPQFHFSPPEMWMNDPNGMVYHDGVYHLFYQHYPDDKVWGPMHWGHATSPDMIHWNHKPIALFPDSLGYIFSGSAVLDKNNTTGFGTNDNPPLVAIYTYHEPVGSKNGEIDYQTQGIAFSLDNGNTWEKYSRNPVLSNPGIRDFRDPKVIWYEATKRWIMTLAVQDHVSFYSSPDLKEWKLESDLGANFGAHGGVWECPDLFQLKIDGQKKWVLMVSINPGGPNGGSATQYFVGDFDGHKFHPFDTEIRWVDYGPDDYAGVTWSNVPDRSIFLGWMSNWKYANQVPTDPWRSAMTIPRELNLVEENGVLLLTSSPVKELESICSELSSLNDLGINEEFDFSFLSDSIAGTYELYMRIDQPESFSIIISNDKEEKVVIGFNKADNIYYIDRSKSGKVDFHDEFGKVYVAPRLTDREEIDVRLVVDVASVELFADGGRTVMTSIFFPTEDYNKLKIIAENELLVKEVKIRNIDTIW